MLTKFRTGKVLERMSVAFVRCHNEGRTTEPEGIAPFHPHIQQLPGTSRQLSKKTILQNFVLMQNFVLIFRSNKLAQTNSKTSLCFKSFALLHHANAAYTFDGGKLFSHCLINRSLGINKGICKFSASLIGKVCDVDSRFT